MYGIDQGARGRERDDAGMQMKEFKLQTAFNKTHLSTQEARGKR